jgi:hypothetical protein
VGTFHDDLGELHGITVVVDTPGDTIYIGRCHEMNDEKIVLLSVDEHTDGSGGASKADWVAKAAKVGVWEKHKTLVLPLTEVASVKRLGEFR